MAGNADLLKEIVEIGRDGADFYESAAQKVSNARLRAVFGRMSAAKRELITALSDHLALGGEKPPDRGTLMGSLRKAYAGVLATLAADDEHVYVAQLEEAEDRLVARIEKAILEAKDTDVRVQLQAYLPKVRACHDEMRELRSHMAA
jgi:uncharacterized protein (TIGR02284 family)